MKHTRSLRLRQISLGVLAIVIALILSWTGFTFLFERHIERRYNDELHAHINAIAAGLLVNEEGRLHLAANRLSPQFDIPLSGYYWRIKDGANHDTLRSRSLWDMDLPQQSRSGRHDGYYIVTRHINLGSHDENRPIEIEAALADRILDNARNDFAYDLGLYLTLLGLVLIILLITQIEFGLKPLKSLRCNVEKLFNTPDKRMEVENYEELEPLTTTINHLLDVRSDAITKAEKRAADLAHGLKSPLAALRNQAARLEKNGHCTEASHLRDLGHALEQQINRELTRTRAEIAAQKNAVSCNIHDLAQQLIRVLHNTAHGELLEWEMQIDKNAILPLDGSDMAEALGPVLENAARYARSCVKISMEKGQLIIDDDGIGMNEEQRKNALKRGVRYDERSSSTGLGLAIAQDVLTPYNWTLKLDTSPLGGLRVILSQL